MVMTFSILQLSGCAGTAQVTITEVRTNPDGTTSTLTAGGSWTNIPPPPPPPPTTPTPPGDDCDLKDCKVVEPYFVLEPVAQYVKSLSNSLMTMGTDSISQSIHDAIASGDYSFDLTTNVPSSFPQNSTSGQVRLTVNGITHTLNVQYAINDHRLTPLDPEGMAAWYDQYKNESVDQTFDFTVNYDGFYVDAQDGESVTETYIIRVSGQEVSHQSRSYIIGTNGGSGNRNIKMR